MNIFLCFLCGGHWVQLQKFDKAWPFMCLNYFCMLFSHASRSTLCSKHSKQWWDKWITRIVNLATLPFHLGHLFLFHSHHLQCQVKLVHHLHHLLHLPHLHHHLHLHLSRWLLMYPQLKWRSLQLSKSKMIQKLKRSQRKMVHNDCTLNIINICF